MKKLLTILGTMFFMCLFIHSDVMASSYTMTANKSSVTTGDSFTISLSASDMYIKFNSFTVSGPATITSSQPSDVDTGGRVTLTLKTTAAGSVTVKMTGTAARYDSAVVRDETISKSVTVSVKDAPKPVIDTRSKENKLSSLTIDQGVLSPTFSSSQTSYQVNVSGEVESITLGAKPIDSKASVSGTGKKSLSVGKNSFVITCTAENGSQLNYTITVNVDDSPIVFLDYDNQKYGFVRNLDGMIIPAGFEAFESKINGHDVTLYYSELLQVTIAYLQDESKEKSFYRLDNDEIIGEFEQVKIDNRIFTIVPIDNRYINREGLTFCKVMVNNYELDGWTYVDPLLKDYYQVYLMNSEGNINLYQYELTEGQLQILAPESQIEETNYYQIATIILSIVSLCSIAGIGYVIKFKK